MAKSQSWQNLEPGTWNLEPGTWNLEPGTWNRTPVGELAFFDAADLLASNYLLPLSGLLIAIYVGWFWSGEEEKEELLAGGAGWVYPLWHFLIRYVSPTAVAIVLYFKIVQG